MKVLILIIFCLNFIALSKIKLAPKNINNIFKDIYFYDRKQKIKKNKFKIQKFCKKINKKFKDLNINKVPCKSIDWDYNLLTPKKNPLIYKVFGSGENIMLIMSGVHPNEKTPLAMGFKLASFLKKIHKFIKTQR
jgi:hypothetical protein